jgi:hypothetical protein
MAANASRDRVRAIAQSDASRDVVAVPLNRTPIRRLASTIAGPAGMCVARTENDKNRFEGE